MPTESPKGIRIVSDGTMMGTEIFNTDGTPIPYVKSVTWELDVKSLLSTATLTIQKVRVDVRSTEVQEVVMGRQEVHTDIPSDEEYPLQGG